MSCTDARWKAKVCWSVDSARWKRPTAANCEKPAARRSNETSFSASALSESIVLRSSSDLAAIPADGPVILASNHVSNLDGVVLGSWLVPRIPRRIHWLGKKEMFDAPVVGQAMKLLGHRDAHERHQREQVAALDQAGERAEGTGHVTVLEDVTWR